MSSSDVPGEQAPRMSVIVPTYNRSQTVAATIADILKQNFKDYELWLVDQSKPEEAARNAAMVASTADPRLHYLHLTRQGLPNARNEGLRRARGEIIVFLDDDIILLSPDFLQAHLDAFDDPRVGGVTGRHVERTVATNSKHTACHVSWGGRTIFNLFGHRRQPVGGCKGSNMSFRAAVLQKTGGFDRNTHLLEDADFSLRVAKAGWLLMYEPAAELVHLSTAGGGVRSATAAETEYQRFTSTAYFIMKHRGVIGCLPFILTFGLIALTRVARYRSFTIIPGCIRAMGAGFALARSGPDQDIGPRL